MAQEIKYTLENAKNELMDVRLIDNDSKDAVRAMYAIEFIFSKLSGDAEEIDCPVCGGSGHKDVWAIAPCPTCKGVGKVYEREWSTHELP